MIVDFYFDPACPWCWITSRWLREVSVARDLDINWRTFSLLIKNQGSSTYSDAFNAHAEHTLEAMEIIEAVRAELGSSRVGDLYSAYGERIHHGGERLPSHEEVLTAVGLETSWAGAAGDERWRKAVEASMEEALDTVGQDIGVPTIVFPGRVGFFGPVVSPAPTGQAALDLFDHVSALARTPGFFELKRGRDVGPRFEERP